MTEEEKWQEFERSSRHICQLIEEVDSTEIESFLHECLIAISKHISIATSLKEVKSSGEVPLDKDNTIDWQPLFDKLTNKLGKANYYNETFDPYFDKELVQGSLSDDLADIYHDIKSGLASLENGVKPDKVRWQWQFDYWAHWGKHATDALRVLYSYLSKERF